MQLNWRNLLADAVTTIAFLYVGNQLAVVAVGLTVACAITISSFVPELAQGMGLADGSFVMTVALTALLASFVSIVPVVAIEIIRRLIGRALAWIYMAAGALTAAIATIGPALATDFGSKALLVGGVMWILSGAVGGAVYWLVTVKLRAALALSLGRMLCGAGSGRCAVGFSIFAIMLGGLATLATTGGAVAEPAGGLHQLCRQVRNDDTLREYSPALRDETVQAFKTLYPEAKSVPADDELETQASFRCMNGKILVCMVGANLPCLKMNTARSNPGADAFCRQERNADSVPAAAVGHDTIYWYRCRNGRAEVVRSSWELDERGFAKKLWAELPGR